MASHRRNAFDDSQHPSVTGLLRCYRLNLDRRSQQSAHRLADQDLARPGGLLESLREGDRRPGDETVSGCVGSGEHFPGFDTDTHLDSRTNLLLELVAEHANVPLELTRSTGGAKRVVLV
jgi:hypothetical protein